jgi:hypothetical protein
VKRALAAAALLAAALRLAAQQNTPHVGYVYPAGGRQGDTFEVTAGGQFLDGVTAASISGSGVQATVIEFVKPLTAGQANKLRDQLKELMDKKAAAKQRWSDDDDKTVADIRKKLATFVRRPASPAIAETVRIEVRLAHDSPPGERELRLTTAAGLTNPLVFCVGQLPEISKKPAAISDELPAAARVRIAPKPAAQPPLQVTLPAILNGQIMPGGVDRYRFHAGQGQHLVVAAGARELIPYISDAVPGWFQAALALYDAGGKEVDFADHYLFHQDPLLYYEIPSDGDYTLEIRDSIYRGREDFVYRIALGELPYVTGIFPLGGRAGKRTTVALAGWNLPSARLAENTKGKAPGVYPISVRSREWTSNRVPFAIDTLPETTEKEPNNRKENAQRLKLPIIVNGRIDRPGDSDVFRFEGRAGDEIVAEVMARRLGSPLDSILNLADAAGHVVAMNDDFEDKSAGLITHQADSFIRAKLPAAGTYYLYLGDTQGKGGAEYAYRLRVSRPQPDFELRVVPASVNVRAGMNVPITVYAVRRDGFSGEIALKLKDAPAGFLLGGAWIPADQDKVRLTLTAPPNRQDKPLSLHLEGRATLQGREVRRAAVPAEDMMQAFFYRHLVPSEEWMVRVTGAARARAAWKPSAEKPVRLPAGGTAPVRVAVPPGRFSDQVQLALDEPPEGISIQKVSTAPDGFAILLRADAARVKPGLKGNLIVDAFTERGVNQAATIKRRTPLGTLPAIPFEVVP